MITNKLNLPYIAARRKKLGLTQGQMARELGMNSAPAYNKYEKGVYKFNAEIIPSLIKTLKCDISDIFCPQL